MLEWVRVIDLGEGYVELAGLLCFLTILKFQWDDRVSPRLSHHYSVDPPQKKKHPPESEPNALRNLEDEWALLVQKDESKRMEKQRVWERKRSMFVDIMGLAIPLTAGIGCWVLEGIFSRWFVTLSSWGGEYDVLVRTGCISLFILFDSAPSSHGGSPIFWYWSMVGLGVGSLLLFCFGHFGFGLFIFFYAGTLLLWLHADHAMLERRKWHGFGCIFVALLGFALFPMILGEDLESTLFLCRVVIETGMLFFFCVNYDLGRDNDAFLSLFLLGEWILTSYFFNDLHIVSCTCILFFGLFPICMTFADRNLGLKPINADVICLFSCALALSYSFLGLEGIIEGPVVSFSLLYGVIMFPSLIVAMEGFSRVKSWLRVDAPYPIPYLLLIFHLTASPLWVSLLFGLWMKEMEWSGGVLGVVSQFGIVLCFFWCVLLFHVACFSSFSSIHPALAVTIAVGAVFPVVGVFGGFEGFFGFYVMSLVWALILYLCVGVVYHDEVLTPYWQQQKMDEMGEKEMLFKASFSTKGSRRRR